MENPFKNIFGKKQVDPQLVPGVASVQDMTYQKDAAGNHFYMFDSEYIRENFLNLKMDTMSGKAQALSVVTPFAAMVERMGKLFAAGDDYVTDEENNENEGSEIYDKVRELIKKPNVFQTSSMFKRQVESYLLVYGFCPIFGFRISKNEVPVTLWCIPPELFHAKMSGDFLMQTEYSDIVEKAWVTIGTKQIDLQPEDYFIVFSGQVDVGKEGEMVVRTPVDTLSTTMNNWVNQAIARGAIIKDGGPKGIISNDDNSEFGNAAMTKKENERLNEAFKEKYGLVGKKFQVLITQAALRWQPMSWDAGQLMLDQTTDEAMRIICFTLGWSYGLFKSEGQYANNVGGEEKRTYTTVIIPDAESYAQALTEFLNQPKLKYYIDYTGVEALQKDKKAEADTLNSIANALNALIGNNAITMLEYRTLLSEYIDIDPEKIPEIPLPVIPLPVEQPQPVNEDVTKPANQT